jgi:hypothetical protein
MIASPLKAFCEVHCLKPNKRVPQFCMNQDVIIASPFMKHHLEFGKRKSYTELRLASMEGVK